jgi:hypothetical protein
MLYQVGRIVNRKCDEPLSIYVVGTSIISLSRLGMATQMCLRMWYRPWDGQTFVEAMGGVWNNVKGQNHPMEVICKGHDLNVWTMAVNLADWVWWWFGFMAICFSDTAICADQATFTAGVLVGYQALNVHGPAFLLDIIIPYYSMEVAHKPNQV